MKVSVGGVTQTIDNDKTIHKDTFTKVCLCSRMQLTHKQAHKVCLLSVLVNYFSIRETHSDSGHSLLQLLYVILLNKAPF